MLFAQIRKSLYRLDLRMYVKGQLTHIVKDCPSYPDLMTIDLSNKRVVSLNQTLSNIIQSSVSNEKFSNNKIQILANDNRLVDLRGIQIVSQKLASIKAHNNRLRNVEGVGGLHFPFLEKMYLQYNQITDLTGIETGQFSRLNRLTINNNKLTSQKLWVLTKIKAPQLRVLGLDNNQIKQIEFIRDIRLHYIIDINLSFNQIEDITPLKHCIFLPKLSKIQLQNNRITSFPDVGLNLSNLRKLSLSNNLLKTAQGLISCQFPNLEVLQMENNDISNIGFLYRLQAPKIIDIKLSKNKIVRVQSRTLRHGCFPALQQLLLKNNSITGALIEELMICFSAVKEIREQFLKEFSVPPSNLEPLKTTLQKKLSIASGDRFYNDNRTFSMFSCWRNKLIVRNPQSVYGKLKRHFQKLSYLQF